MLGPSTGVRIVRFTAARGYLPTKVPKVSEEFCQVPMRKGFPDLLEIPRWVLVWSVSFGGLIPTESLSLSSEKSYSPNWQKAGMSQPVHPHLFRHQMLTYLTPKGLSDAQIQLISGHESKKSDQ
jgi:hypothetical protein